jgi:hypothetical protein
METPGDHQGERSEPERAERRVVQHAGGPWPRAWWRSQEDQDLEATATAVLGHLPAAPPEVGA